MVDQKSDQKVVVFFVGGQPVSTSGEFFEMSHRSTHESSQIKSFMVEWRQALVAADISAENIVWTSEYDPSRRVYYKREYIAKIRLKNYRNITHQRENTLWGEFLVLMHCEGITGLPTAIYWESDEIYEMIVISSVPPHQSRKEVPLGYVRSLVDLTWILIQLSRRGISHNDLTANNVIFSNEGKAYLIDFDQATISLSIRAFVLTFLGLGIEKGKERISMIDFMKNEFGRYLPVHVVGFFRRILGKDSRDRLPVLSDGASNSAKELYLAWEIARKSNASAPGVSIAYYSFSFEGVHFPGERPWLRRWETISVIEDYSGLRVLELGCNMSLLSCYLLSEAGAEASLAVDIDASILNSARHVSSALNVSPSYEQVDFDSKDDWESRLSSFAPDLVFALNVLNWVDDKPRLIRFLSRFDRVIFEGHDTYEIESKRFIDAGFSSVELVSLTERDRPLIYCTKTPSNS
jgi:tRNA A-37 threonylcarbamoyl transferase component Bud32